MKLNLLKLIIALAVCQLAGLIGSIFTSKSIPTWYNTITKPSFNPPNWIFGPVWTILFICMGIALYLVWNKGVGAEGVKVALVLFSIQLVLNILWSLLFFGLHSPLLGLIEIILLEGFIIATTILFFRISTPAGWLMVPYILWVGFATVLNFSLWILNR